MKYSHVTITVCALLFLGVVTGQTTQEDFNITEVEWSDDCPKCCSSCTSAVKLTLDQVQGWSAVCAAIGPGKIASTICNFGSFRDTCMSAVVLGCRLCRRFIPCNSEYLAYESCRSKAWCS